MAALKGAWGKEILRSIRISRILSIVICAISFTRNCLTFGKPRSVGGRWPCHRNNRVSFYRPERDHAIYQPRRESGPTAKSKRCCPSALLQGGGSLCEASQLADTLHPNQS